MAQRQSVADSSSRASANVVVGGWIGISYLRAAPFAGHSVGINGFRRRAAVPRTSKAPCPGFVPGVATPSTHVAHGRPAVAGV